MGNRCCTTDQIYDDKESLLGYRTETNTQSKHYVEERKSDYGLREPTQSASRSCTAPMVLFNDSINDKSYSGFISQFDGLKLRKYWGMLNGPTLSLYRHKPSPNVSSTSNVAYDLINISGFYDVRQYELDDDSERYRFGITFADQWGDFDVEYFMLKSQREQTRWFNAFKSVMRIDQNIIRYNRKHRIPARRDMVRMVHCGWVLYGDSIYWMELFIEGTELMLFRDDRNERPKLMITRDDLMHYDGVELMYDGDHGNGSNTRFRFGFMLQSDDSESDLVVYCRSDHDRAQWMAHCDYIIANGSSPLPKEMPTVLPPMDVSRIYGHFKPTSMHNVFRGNRHRKQLDLERYTVHTVLPSFPH